MKTNFDFDLMAANMQTMKSAFKVSENEEQALGAFICTARGRSIDTEAISRCKEIIKAEHGAFTKFRGHLELPLVVQMALSGNPEGYLSDVTKTYESLSEEFKLGNDSRLLAAMIICDNSTAESRDTVIQRTIELFKKTKDNKSVPSDQDDFPMFALLAASDKDIDAMLTDVGSCFDTINANFKLSKSEVLTSSLILGLNDKASDDKSSSFMDMYKTFKDDKYAIKGRYLSMLSVLVNSGIAPAEALTQSKDNDAKLKEVKSFHGVFGIDSGVRRTYASAITVLNNTDDNGAIEGAVMSTILSVVISIEMTVMLMMITAMPT